MISGGVLSDKATVMRASTSVDALGRRSTTFTDVGTVRCDFRPGPPAEQEFADGVAVGASHEVHCRWPDIGRLSITAVDRLTINARTMRIVGIEDVDYANRKGVIYVREVV